MGPLIKLDPNVATPIKKMLSKIFGLCFPSVIISKLDESEITRDEAVVKRVIEDPLGWHGGMKLGLANVLLNAIEIFEKTECLKTITAPLLVLQGGQDKIVLPEGAPFVHDNVGSVNKKLVVYEGAYHNLYCELEDVKAASIKETCSWIEQYS